MLNIEMKLAQPWKLRKKREASVFSPASTYTLCIFISGTVLGFGDTDTNQKSPHPRRVPRLVGKTSLWDKTKCLPQQFKTGLIVPCVFQQ